MIRRIFPARLDNESYCGAQTALWLFAFFLLMKAVMGVNGAINTQAVATGADGIDLDDLGRSAADTILMLFRSLSLAQLPVVAIGATVLWRWRAMVPFLYFVLIADQLVRRLAALANPAARASDAGSIGLWINLGLFALLIAGFALSLRLRPSAAGPAAAS